MSRPPGPSRHFRFLRPTRRRVAEDVDAELSFHLARKAEELMAAGLAPDDARHEAARRFGDLEYTRRYCRDEDVRREQKFRHLTIMDELRQDIVYALRALRSAPGFAAAALLTLALGIGGNTAIFSVVRGVLLRPLPFPSSEQVVRVWHANRVVNDPKSKVSEPDFKDWQSSSTRFASLGAYWYAPGSSGGDLTGLGDPERMEGAYVTPGFFESLRTPAEVGRTIRAEEAVAGNDHFVVLSHAFWRRRFAGDPSVIGRALTISGVPQTVLGVMPPGFAFPGDHVDFWIPLSTIPESGIGRGRSSRFLDVVGRLAPGATIQQAHEELAALSRRVAERDAEARDWTDVTVLPVREALLGDVRRPLVVLMGAVAFVLLITCVNIASLLLARATARQQELAVRSALGAGRGRLLRQLVAESLVLALIGGALGVALAYAGVRAFGSLGAADLPRAGEIRIDGAVLLYALGVSTLAGLFFGLLPALRATSPNLQGALRAGSRGSVGAAGQRLRSALVVAEVALAVVLVVGAGLAAKSFARLLEVDPGFHARNVLAVKLNMRKDSTVQREVYYNTLFERIAAIPGVEAVGAAKNFPLRGTGEFWPGVVVPGGSGAADRELRLPVMHVSTDYFRAMGIPLRAGRTFTAADTKATPQVLLVNETFARRYWPNESAIGKTLRVDGGSIQIVGVVGDVRQASLTEPAEPTGYIHYLQNMRSGLNIAVRTKGDPMRYANAVRQAIWSVNRDQTIINVETMSGIVDASVARQRILAALLVLFGLTGLLLGALGIYGVLAFTVNQRRQEIGVRVALGATPRSVLGLVVRQGMTLAILGVVAGVAGALVLTRGMSAVLYDVRATDPATFASVVTVLLGAALVASWLPARRALRVNPVQALRYD